jgi:serine protease Do
VEWLFVKNSPEIHRTIMFIKSSVRITFFMAILATSILMIQLAPGTAAAAPTPTPTGTNTTLVDANIFVNLAKKMVPSVVNISSITTAKSPYMQGGTDDVFRKFFGDLFRQYNSRGGRGGSPDDDEDEGGPALPPANPPGGPSRLPKSLSLGTGFIVDASGLILTNNHVVADADEIKISFTESLDEKPTDAEVVGRDPDLDIALIKVKNKRPMVPVVLGDSDALEVGEYVMAVGNPFGQGHSVTHGIISAKGRFAPDFPLANYLQTDAPINPGNSGGPLINLKGEVIGINNAIDQRAQGIGFAIPINIVKKILPQLRTKGSVSRGYIGVVVDPLTPEIAAKIGVSPDLQGPVVSHVYPGDPADKAGLKPYDVILEFNGQPVHSGNDLIVAVTSVNVGQSVTLKVSRGGKSKSLTIKVGQRPDSSVALQKESKGKKTPKKQSVDLGMTIEDMSVDLARELGMSEKASGLVVTQVAYGGPADRAGMIRGDVIIEIDRKPVKDTESFYSTVKEKKSYLLRVRRSDPQGRESFTVVVLDLKS